jgi:hypothetical protein
MSRLRNSVQVGAVLFFASVAAADEFTYIVPVSGSVRGRDAAYFGSVRVINTSSEPARVEIADLIPGSGPSPCSSSGPVTLAPGEITTLGADGKMNCSGIYSVVLRSDRAIHVQAQVLGLNGSLGTFSEQHVDEATRWIEPGERALIADVYVAPTFGQLGNLFLVNPNAFPIDVTVTIDRPEVGAKREDTFTVEAHALRQFVIQQVENPAPVPIIQLFNFTHNLTLVANGRFQAGASSVGRPTAYRPAIILNQ